MSLKALLIGLPLSLLLSNGCKTPGAQSSLKSEANGMSDEEFFEAKTTCQSRMGLRLDNDMKVAAIDLTSYADVMGLEMGDFLTELNAEKVDSPSEFERLCLEIGEKRPSLWRYTIQRRGGEQVLGDNASMECDYLTLVGCAPIPRRAKR